MAMGMTAMADGTNSITVTNAKVGERYNIYKMLDLSVDNQTTPTAYRYTINTTWKDFWTTGAGKDYVDTNTAGSDTYVVWKADKSGEADMEAFAKAAAKWASDHSINADATEITVESNGIAKWDNLDNGYYLVTSTYGIAASVASTPANPAQTIAEKNNENATTKRVQENGERNGTAASWADANDASIGDTITFRSQVSIAKNSINVVYHDTMDSGLTFSGYDSVQVYMDEGCTTELDTDNYSVTSGDAGETFKVTFTNDYVAGLTDANTNVYIKYTAILNDDAVVGTKVNNTGIVKWGKDSESATTTTSTATHKFTILKYDATDTAKKPLAGAKFKLYTDETDGTALKLAKNEAGTIYRVVDTSDNGVTLPAGYTLVDDDQIVTLDSGVITIEGVDSDDYWLEETEAPKGYTILAEREKVQVSDNNALCSEIENKSGNLLPSTGGIGTTIFYIIGAILVIGVAIIFIVRRRMDSER